MTKDDHRDSGSNNGRQFLSNLGAFLIGIVTAGWTVYTFNEARLVEMHKPFLDAQYHMYTEYLTAAGKILLSQAQDSRETLYVLDCCESKIIPIDADVLKKIDAMERALKDWDQSIHDAADGKIRDSKKVAYQASIEPVAEAMRNSIIKSWSLEWPVPLRWIMGPVQPPL